MSWPTRGTQDRRLDSQVGMEFPASARYTISRVSREHKQKPEKITCVNVYPKYGMDGCKHVLLPTTDILATKHCPPKRSNLIREDQVVRSHCIGPPRAQCHVSCLANLPAPGSLFNHELQQTHDNTVQLIGGEVSDAVLLYRSPGHRCAHRCVRRRQLYGIESKR